MFDEPLNHLPFAKSPRPSYSSIRPHRRTFNEYGHAHELTFSCFHRYRFLAKQRTCEWLAESIQEACLLTKFSLWAFVFMPDHVHLIVHSAERRYDVSQLLSRIKQPTSRRALSFLRKESPGWLERLKVQRGKRIEYHFWQKGGGFDRNITEPKTLQRMVDYIHLNPVRKGLVENASDWPWSSASYFLFQQQHDSLSVTPLPVEWSLR